VRLPVLVTITALILSFGSALAQPSGLYMRVFLNNAPSIALTFSDSHTAYYADGNVLNRSDFALEWRMAVGRNGRIWIESAQGPFDTGRDSLVFEANPRGVFQYGSRAYRGWAVVSVRAGGLQLVNSLPVEDYVRAVLPGEMPSGWPFEALKAQAIIARTYAISRLNSVGDYDICATERCQVYNGASGETTQANAATEATTGLIISYGNRPAQTFFHADSGGYTASSAEIWGSTLPYLMARSDPASTSPDSSWRLQPTAGAIAGAVARFAPRVGAFRGLNVLARTSSGRVGTLEIVGSAGSVRLGSTAAYGFIRALGAKSSLVNVVSNSPLVLVGAGNGHGVGLSQWGARGLAAQGWTFEQILGYYYQNVSLSSYVLGGQTQ
jgi:stage II sporulation protein D